MRWAPNVVRDLQLGRRRVFSCSDIEIRDVSGVVVRGTMGSYECAVSSECSRLGSGRSRGYCGSSTGMTI